MSKVIENEFEEAELFAQTDKEKLFLNNLRNMKQEELVKTGCLIQQELLALNKF